jgi:hypothetical protein
MRGVRGKAGLRLAAGRAASLRKAGQGRRRRVVTMCPTAG